MSAYIFSKPHISLLWVILYPLDNQASKAKPRSPAPGLGSLISKALLTMQLPLGNTRTPMRCLSSWVTYSYGRPTAYFSYLQAALLSPFCFKFNLFKNAIKFDFINAYVFWLNQLDIISSGDQTSDNKQYIDG